MKSSGSSRPSGIHNASIKTVGFEPDAIRVAGQTEDR